MDHGYPKTYLQYRRGLTFYYRYESAAEKARLFSRKMRAHWKDQWTQWTRGNRGIDCSDATCCVMTTSVRDLR
jgi:hypothetical protein